MKKSTHLDLACFGGTPSFDEQLHVGAPNVGNREAFFKRANQMFDNNRLTNAGPFVRELEEKLSDLLDVKHAIAMCNGTIALEIAIRALELKGEVILPSMTFVATAHSLQWQEITPVFVDINPSTHLIDPSRVEELITPKTTGIIGVHLWGRPCDTSSLQKIADRNKLKLMYDAAHAFSTSKNDTMVGNFGDLEVFSFHATKVFNTFEGGAITTNNDELAEKIRLMQNFGFRGKDNVIYIGTNGKMSEISAAMGLTGLESLDKFIEANRRTYDNYLRNLDNIPGLQILKYDPKDKNNYQYFIMEIDEKITGIDRDSMMKILHEENIIARRYFYPGCHKMEPYKSFQPSAHLLLPETEKLLKRVLALPCGSQIDESSAQKISNLIKLIVGNSGQIKSLLSENKGKLGATSSTTLEKTSSASRPRISVEMGCYNFGKYIGEAIESVLTQTLKPFEFIITDDASTDNSWEVIESYSKKFPDLIRAFRMPENKGMQYCGVFRKNKVKGDLISAIDGDDRWLPEKLEKEWLALQKNPHARIAYSNVFLIDETGNRIGEWAGEDKTNSPSGDVFVKVFAKRFFKNTTSIFRNQLMYYESFKEVGYEVSDPRIVHTDWDRKIRLTAKFPVAFSGESLVEYRQHSGGISTLKSSKLYDSHITVIKKNLHLLSRRNKNEIGFVTTSLKQLLKLEGSRFPNTRPEPFFEIFKQPIVVNGLPGAGINTVIQILSLFPGLQESDLHLSRLAVNNISESETGIPIGIDMPKRISKKIIEESIEKLKQNHFFSGHLPYSEELDDLFSKYGFKMLLLLRDSNSLIPSHIHQLSSSKDHPLYHLFSQMSPAQQKSASMDGINSNGQSLLGLNRRIDSVKGWLNKGYVHAIRFEDLTSDNAELKFREVEKLASILSIELTLSEINSIVQKTLTRPKGFPKAMEGRQRKIEGHQAAIEI